MGTMATLSPRTNSDDWPRTAATITAMKKNPATAMRHPLNAPKKNMPERDFRRGMVSGTDSISAVAHADEEPEVRDLGDAADDLVADVMRFGEVVPFVRQELFDGEREPLVVGVDARHSGLNGVALLQNLIGMLEATVPRHVGDVNESVDPFLELHERAEVREIANLSVDDRADGVALANCFPRILFQRFQRERDAAIGHVDVGDDGLHFATDGENLRRIADLLGPRHLGDVDQSFDTLLQLHECPVIGQRHDFAMHLRAQWITLHDIAPRIGTLLLVAERDALRLRIELQDHDVNLVANVEIFGRVIDAAPRDIGDVEQAVDATEVDEHTVVRDVLHDATR